jgi:predicted Zn finger-like uncharacterized protein
MVIRCTHCKGIMRLDETKIPGGGGVTIRCPRCQGVDYVQDPSQAKGGDSDKGLSVPKEIVEKPQKSSESTRRPAPKQRVPSSDVSEVTMPSDAFQGFRFPAEEKGDAFPKRRLSRRARLLLWGIASLVVVALFALLVNIVLPGPGGNRPFGGAIAPDQTQHRQLPDQSDPVNNEMSNGSR